MQPTRSGERFQSAKPQVALDVQIIKQPERVSVFGYEADAGRHGVAGTQPAGFGALDQNGPGIGWGRGKERPGQVAATRTLEASHTEDLPRHHLE
jgi:hypothetical protein